jgi:hypothetical protein
LSNSVVARSSRVMDWMSCGVELARGFHGGWL